MPISSRHVDGTHVGGLMSTLVDKEMRNLFESIIVRKTSRQSCDQICVAQSGTCFKTRERYSTSALQSTTPISSVA